MIDLLARPILDLLATLGTGEIPSGGPADIMRGSGAAIDAAQSLGRVAIAELAASWNGDAAAAAIASAENANASAVALADHGQEIAAVVDQACEATRAGFVELQSIVHSFVGIAMTAGPMIATPPGQTMLIAAAIEHLERALAVVARVRGELATYAARITELSTPPPVPGPAGGASVVPPAAVTSPASVSTAPASASPDPVREFARTFSQGLGSTGPASAGEGLSNFLGARPTAAVDTAVPGPNGVVPGPSGGAEKSDLGSHGVEVQLPDGSVAIAPNENAAGAVRNALSQQGVPYVWGGTEPGRGLDCSGLTQWAYGEQGVELPRLAQEQNVGTPVSQSDLMPGDLAVWDGHVAMVIGNGQFVEAGDPVQVGPIRTSNSGMGFMGFYRPTE